MLRRKTPHVIKAIADTLRIIGSEFYHLQIFDSKGSRRAVTFNTTEKRILKVNIL
jgi:hypothetical protein